MGKTDRREKLALDDAYQFFRSTLEHDHLPDIYALVKALKTVSSAVKVADSGQFKLTARLWKRIQQALFDKLLTSYSAHIVVYDAAGQSVAARTRWPEHAVIEVHPEGLRRDDDCFTMHADDLHPVSRERLARVWNERGNATRREDFTNMDECGDFCAPKPFVVGHELLMRESVEGKALAYRDWWELYWQAYCTPHKREKQLMMKQMAVLENVWGNLNY